MNTPFGNSITTAEHAIALMFALARQLPEADASTQAGKWEKNRFMGVELTAKTLGLIGAGNIGSIVASRALGLKMKVDRLRPLPLADARSNSDREGRARQLLARADFITLHTPLTDQTRGILAARRWPRSKKGVASSTAPRRPDRRARAQGGTLEERPRRRRRARTCSVEEPARDNPLFAPPVSSPPRISPSTTEAQSNVALQVPSNERHTLRGGVPMRSTAQPLGRGSARLKPYMRSPNARQPARPARGAVLSSIEVEGAAADSTRSRSPAPSSPA
jgi:D-3-phosphoglycerate dehydrogenase